MTAHPVIRVLHDAGAAAWFGGSLMGATGLNAAASMLDDPAQRAKASTAGWSRWAPVNGAAVLAHVVGAAGLLRTDAYRVAGQEGVARSSAVKTGLTAAGLGVAAWSAVLNRKMAAAGPVPVHGSTEPSDRTPQDVATVQRQLKVVQWLNPLIAGAVIGVGSWQSEQQRTMQVVPGLVKGLSSRVPTAVPVLALAGLAAVAAKRRSGSDTVEAYPQPVVPRPAPTVADDGRESRGPSGSTVRVAPDPATYPQA